MILPALTSPTVAALALAAVAPAPQKSAEPILPPADEALVIEAGAITCLSLLQRYHSVTGENFTYSTEVRERLDRPLLIEQRLEAPVGEVHTAVQELLVQEGFFLSVIRSEDIHILKVEAADEERAPSTRRPAATVLPIARIDTARQYPAMLFMTVVNVESGDVQRLGRALQILVRGRRPDEVLVVANTSSIVLIGTGERVAAMADLLKPESIPDADVLVEELPLERISGSEAVEALERRLADWKGDGKPRPRIAAHPRRSSILAVGTQNGIEWLREVLKELDR
ncbi:MAG: hypothetical protein AAF957_22640 [Planctomycetota bacterium]